MICLVHVALPALSQCHLHFPHRHYQALAVCYAFIPQVDPHMKITHYIPTESLQLNFVLLTISCTVTSWLPLCFLCEITVPWDCKYGKANYLTNVRLLSWGGQFFSFPSISPPLFCSAGRQKEVRATEVLFGYLFMAFPFNIHAFFRTIWVQRRMYHLGMQPWF